MTTLEIQRALLARGYDPGPLDGDPGARTIAALTAFQRAAGLVPDGIAGKLTIGALNQISPIVRKADSPEPAWLVLARGEVGTIEGIGTSNNPKVLAYFKDAGFAGVKDDATAWCAAFVGAELHRAGQAPSGSLAARSYETWGVGLAKPVLGCIATKKRAGSAWQGHVGIVVGASDNSIILLGGNQQDSVNIASFPRAEFTSFRWPANVPIPTASILPTTIGAAKSGVSEA